MVFYGLKIFVYYCVRYTSHVSLLFSAKSTVSHEEMNRFRQYSSKWWTPGGEYDALRALNDLRVPTITKLLTQKNNKNNTNERSYKPLRNYKILDVGCGGGILAEVSNFSNHFLNLISYIFFSLGLIKYATSFNPTQGNMSGY